MASSAGFAFSRLPLQPARGAARSAAVGGNRGASAQHRENHFIHGSQLGADGYSRKSGGGKTLSFHP
jgi:hypothetical protein